MENVIRYDHSKIYRKETNILVLDHNQEMVASLAKILMVFAYTVFVAQSEDVAFLILSDDTKKIDLVIMDAGLANGNGSFLFSKIKTKIPTILMSSDYGFMDAKEALNNGAYFYMRKPIGLHNIINLWQHAMSAKFQLKPNMKYNGKRVEIIGLEENNETERFENNKAAKLKKRAAKKTICRNGTDERKRRMKAHGTSKAYQVGYNIAKSLETMNVEPSITQTQVAGSVQSRHRGPGRYGRMPMMCMPVNSPQQPSLQGTEVNLWEHHMALIENNVNSDAILGSFSGKNNYFGGFPENMAAISTNLIKVDDSQPSSSKHKEGPLEEPLVPLFVNNSQNDNAFFFLDFDFFLDNAFRNIDDFSDFLDSLEPFLTNSGTNTDAAFEMEDFNNFIFSNVIETTPSPHEVDDQMLSAEDFESFPYGDYFLMFDEAGEN